ncbi:MULTISPECIES: RDD family protein [unclassified Lysobacter]|uniref:RDD family protein n=1 Tax=unclassified Lysobacter TaxID=2635362 RepID=UPI001BE7FF89|nr:MULTISPECIES: RDD family protein [unclassified Lysobacter]MBT2749185.1 RDD family protein [Lysobacter sp. ISL-42]MBT2753937.1 RDD family protein [Lysobacter sp. ISL-50]MBT2779585.1 RDD family protein [Lysobacter sp. ISL-54]MBT2784509.1 RDD family protein [Lysobacter sp. ISL-52]
MDPQNPYQSPQSSLATPDTGNQELADRGVRLVAAIIDGVIMLVLMLPLMFIGGYFNAVMEASQTGQQPYGLQILWGIGGLLLFFAVQYLPLSQTGQTWGKKVMKIKIVDLDGQKPSIGTLLGKRYLFSQGVGIIPCLGAVIALVDVLMIFREDRRCLHDQIAGTRVVIAR